MSVKNYTKALLFGTVIMSIHLNALGQGAVFGDDYKKELWKTIKPSEKKSYWPSPSSTKNDSKSVIDNKYIKSYNNYKLNSNLDHLLEITEPKYKLNPYIGVYNGVTPINQLPAGSTQIVFMGGHFYFVGTGGSLVFPSGIDLLGGGPKKLSEKSKNILINVFGMEIDE